MNFGDLLYCAACGKYAGRTLTGKQAPSMANTTANGDACIYEIPGQAGDDDSQRRCLSLF
jgi:hypothetical protein